MGTLARILSQLSQPFLKGTITEQARSLLLPVPLPLRLYRHTAPAALTAIASASVAAIVFVSVPVTPMQRSIPLQSAAVAFVAATHAPFGSPRGWLVSLIC